MTYADNKAWREAHPDKRHDWKARYRASTGAFTAGRRRAHWTGWEDALVVEHAVSDRDLAKRLQRSVSAIQHRRARLKAKGDA